MDLKYEIEQVALWIKEYFETAKARKAVIGISGGIDSAVTAALCVKALGTDNVLGVVLPCISAHQDSHDARLVYAGLGISRVYMNLDHTFNQWWNTYRELPGWNIYDNGDGDLNSLIPANAKARLRMLTLYAIAGQTNGLVVGTTNKTEAMLGYATKYGDGGVDIEPLMEFYKTEIFEMGWHLAIDSKIINKAPSAGLWLGQTDEGELGMTYEVIDRGLKAIEGTLIDGGGSPADIGRLKKLIAANKHKDLGLPHYKRQ